MKLIIICMGHFNSQRIKAIRRDLRKLPKDKKEERACGKSWIDRCIVGSLDQTKAWYDLSFLASSVRNEINLLSSKYFYLASRLPFEASFRCVRSFSRSLSHLWQYNKPSKGFRLVSVLPTPSRKTLMISSKNSSVTTIVVIPQMKS